MYKDITGIILSGGKSTRMGENKSFLKIGDIYVIEKITNLMKSIFEEVIIISNEPELYKFLNIKCFKDKYRNSGPIAGIHSGLTHSKTDLNFIISCDMPLINAEMIKSIINYPREAPLKVPKADGFIQQLCGLYNKSLLPEIGKLINMDIIENRDSSQHKRKCKVHHLISTANAVIIENVEDLKGYHKDIFLNMNTVEDYQKILSLS